MKHRKLSLALLTFVAAAAFFWPRPAPAAPAGAGPTAQSRRVRTQRRRTPDARRGPRVDYSKFSHSTAAHRRDACASCHQSPSGNWAKVRARDSAFPDVTDYPEHASCLECHRGQFFSGARPVICSVCHTAVSPRAGDRHAFANPAEPFARSPKSKTATAEFAPVFPHDVHQDVMARTPSPDDSPRFVRAAFAQDAPKQERPNSCSICHVTYSRPALALATPAATAAVAATAATAESTTVTLPDGLLKTTPTGHESCFNCHWQDGGEKPFSSDCAGCHKLIPRGEAPAPPRGRDADPQLAARAGLTDPFVVRKLLRRESATFAHEEESHRAIDCASCHTRIPALSTLDDSTLKVPVLSCGGGSGCHISARPRKILNEEVDRKLADANFLCVKCHVNLGREKPPRSHLDAVGK